MIIELFGPPAAGKTTFARTLATRLRDLGHPVELMLSYRPSESGDTFHCRKTKAIDRRRTRGDGPEFVKILGNDAKLLSPTG